MSYLNDKTTLFVLRKDSELAAKGKQFRVKNEDGVRSIPIVKILDIVAHNSVKIGKAALTLASENNIPIHFINGRGDYYGTFANGLGANIFLRKLQYEKRFNKDFIIKIVKKIVEGKSANQKWLFESFQESIKLPEVKQGNSIENFLGQEGKISALYWKYFPILVKNPEFEFKKRVKHPPSNEINALLSLGYVLLVNRITSILSYIGLDPYLGFYHQDFYKRPALALDLMEEWRPIAVDKFVLTLINRREIKKEDFLKEGTAVRLTPKARNEFIAKWYQYWSKRKFYSKNYKAEATLSQFCEWQCRKFSKVITGELQKYTSFEF